VTFQIDAHRACSPGVKFSQLASTVNHGLEAKYYLQNQRSRDKGSVDKNTGNQAVKGDFMVKDIPEKPAPGDEPQPDTVKETKRKSKSKSATAAKKTTRPAKSSRAKSAKAGSTSAKTARKKTAKSQPSTASTRAASASTKRTARASTGKTEVKGNAAGNDPSNTNEKGPGVENQDRKAERDPSRQRGTEAVGAKVSENLSIKAATDDTVAPATPKTTWTPVLPKTHEVGDSSLPPEEEPDPMKKMLVYAGAALALIVFLIFVASLQNMRKYYVVERDNAVEVWKGRFSPLGREKLAVLPGVKPPEETKEVYTRQDVFPMLFTHYIQKADASIEAAGSPDFSKIKSILTQAGAYATSAEDRAIISERLHMITRTILLYKADVAAEKGTIKDLQAAQAHLGRAAALQPDAILANFIQQKMDSIQEQIASLKAGPAPEQKLEAPPEETPPPAPKSDEPNPPETAPAEKTAPAARGTT
jgi:hypothetical protein